jgi:hypothetical protein
MAKAPPSAERDTFARFKIVSKPVETLTTDEMFTQVARLDLAKRENEAEAEKIKARLDEIEPLLINRMIDNETQRQTVQGITVYLRRELWASATSVLGLKRWLAYNRKLVPNASSIVKPTANTQTLSALVREMVRTKLEELGPAGIGKKPEELLPEKLLPHLKITEKTKLGFNKADVSKALKSAKTA